MRLQEKRLKVLVKVFPMFSPVEEETPKAILDLNPSLCRS